MADVKSLLRNSVNEFEIEDYDS